MRSFFKKKFVRYFLYTYLLVVLSVGVIFAAKGGTSLSAVAARYIDTVLPDKKMPFSERMVRGFKARSVSLFVYPVYAITDVCYLLPKAFFEYSVSGLFTQPLKMEYFEAAANDATFAKRSLIGIVGTPSSLISADFVTRHFLTDDSNNGLVRSGGGYYSAPGKILFPRGVGEIQELVQYASKNARRITIQGSGLSQGKHCLPIDEDDLVISLKHLKSVDINPDQKTAIVQAGAKWRDVQEAINPHKLSVKVMQASNIFSVGGSLSANCHGWDHRFGTLGSTTRSITIVNAEGKLKKLKPTDPEFRLVVGGYGLCGIIVEAELELTDNTMLVDRGEEVAIDEYVNYFHEKVMGNSEIEMHLYRLSLQPGSLLSDGIAQNYVRESESVVSPLVDEAVNGKRIERIGVHSARKFAAVRKAYWKSEKKNILRPVSISRNEAMRAPIKAMFNYSNHDKEWLQEFYLPAEGLSSFLKELGALLNDYKVCLLNASVRFVKQDSNALMGYSKDGDSFAVVLCFNQPLSEREVDFTREWVSRAIDLTLKYQGTYYLPYQHFASESQFNRSYPQFQEFVAEKNKVDPQGIFVSQFYEHHLKEGDTAVDPFTLLKDDPRFRREFRRFFRNVFLNLDEDAFIKLSDQVLESEMTHEGIYKAFEKNLSVAQPNSLKGAYLSLKALRNQRAAVRKQLDTLFGKDFAADGYVEIGFPGRMISNMKGATNLTGKVYVVNSEESLADYLQCGFPRPYDTFVPLNDYEPLTNTLDKSSVDIISSFIGLHHCPEDKLDAFVQSITDVLRPDGSFVLRDHDAHTPKLHAMATLAHFSFNLGTGVPWKDEKSEVRNFQGLAYWDALMERHGLKRDKSVSPLVRAGDPTMNTLVRYKKKETVQVSEPRKQLQTFMTTVEWLSVRASKDYAAFIEHTPFYMYPYFSQINNFWQALGQSWSESRKYHSRYEIITSDYFAMNLFIASFHTVEYFLKGIISAPIATFYQSEENLEPDTINLIAEKEGEQFEIKLPRYMKFQYALQQLLDSGVKVINIAGQSRIQVQCTVSGEFITPSGCHKIGELTMPNEPGKKVTYLNVEVAELHNVLKDLRLQDVRIDYIHDF